MLGARTSRCCELDQTLFMRGAYTESNNAPAQQIGSGHVRLLAMVSLFCLGHSNWIISFPLIKITASICSYYYFIIYHFDTSHQRKPQGYISNIPWEQVYIMIYPAAMVTSQ